ncbi:hypothetical protein AB0M12_10825 [Nocardia vinacea]|uniref:hypothetical protein n=1 Tax=Nocardia vinacea TaxID=96468 RepID=UPI00342AC690
MADPQPNPEPADKTTSPTERVAGGLDARYEQLRHAALHARAEAFPLGFAVLARRGVLAWRATVTRVVRAIPTGPRRVVLDAVASLPAAVTAELVDALAGLTLARS